MQVVELILIATVTTSEFVSIEGTLSSELVVVREGEVTVTRQGKLITTLEEGKYFGELSILLGKRLCQVRGGTLTLHAAADLHQP